MAEHRAWAPDASVETARHRAKMLAKARAYFHEQGVMEIDTPALSHAAPSDAAIEPISALLQLRKNTDYFLHTSPEFCMKRMLCAGYPDIYQICKVFRDNEAGRMHQPEFTMIEWYRLGMDFDAIINDTLRLFESMLEDRVRLAPPQRVNYQDTFKNVVGVDPIDCTVAELQSLANADRDLIAAVGEHRDSWLDLLLDTRILPSFASDCLTALCHYPSSQAVLARTSPANGEVAERFEIFYGRYELANGFVELGDAAELGRRIESDNSRRKERRLPTRPVDHEFVAAMRHGLPACAGVAAGFDRLLMIATGTKDIRDVFSFAFKE